MRYKVTGYIVLALGSITNMYCVRLLTVLVGNNRSRPSHTPRHVQGLSLHSVPNCLFVS